MKIEIVQLENIRSHLKSTVPFSRGFNCLVGGLGSGKSSILYAIDFALFGEPVSKSYEYLLREGAVTGKVVVQFTQNGNSYMIQRGLRRRGKSINQDPAELKLFENEALLADTKSEAVAEQLKAISGLDHELFREIVWVRQEHLKELLNARPRDRQTRLDELFGLADYELAWASLAGYEKEYEGERRAYETDPDIAGMEKLHAEHNRAVQEFSMLEIERSDLEKRLGHAERTLEEAESNLNGLEQVRTKNEELKRKEAQAIANLANLQEALASLSEKIKCKDSDIETLKQRLSMLQTQVDAFREELTRIDVPADQPVDALRLYVAAFDDQVSSLRAEQETVFKLMQQDKKRVAELAAKNLCPLCLQTLTEDYKSSLIQWNQAENDDQQKTIIQLQRDVEELQQTKTKANTAFLNLQANLPKIDDLRMRIEEELHTLTGLSEEFGTKQRQEAETRDLLEGIRVEISKFDISELEAARKRRNEAYDAYHLLDRDLQVRKSRLADLMRRTDEIKNRIDQAQQKLERVQKIVKISQLMTDIREAYRGIQPKLRGEFIKVLRNFVQQVLDRLIGDEGPLLNVKIDDTYTPYVRSESGVEREVSYLSGGERTLLAFAYRLGLGQLMMQSRTGRGLSMLLLDEPTESLGREDGSIDRLAEAISRFKAVEQIIAVTHSEAFAEKAEHVIRLEKEAGASRVSIEK